MMRSTSRNREYEDSLLRKPARPQRHPQTSHRISPPSIKRMIASSAASAKKVASRSKRAPTQATVSHRVPLRAKTRAAIKAPQAPQHSLRATSKTRAVLIKCRPMFHRFQRTGSTPPCPLVIQPIAQVADGTKKQIAGTGSYEEVSRTSCSVRIRAFQMCTYASWSKGDRTIPAKAMAAIRHAAEMQTESEGTKNVSGRRPPRRRARQEGLQKNTERKDALRILKDY